MRTYRNPLSAVALVTAAVMTPAVHAATYTWTGTAGDGVWLTGASVANWVDDTAAVAYAPGNGGGNSFVFSAAGANTPTITLKNGHNPNINNMTVNANAASTVFVIDANSHLDFSPTADGAETLSVNGNSTAAINATSPTGTTTGGGNVQLFSQNENAWRISSGVFTINAPIVGSGNSRGISKRGGGTLRLTGASTFGGMLVAADGTIEISSLGDIGVTSAAGTGSGITNGQIQLSRTTSASHLNGTLTYTGGDTSSNRAILIAKDNRDVPGTTDFARLTSTTGTLTLTGGITATAGGDLSHFVDFTVGGNGNMVVNNTGVLGDINVIKTGTGRVEINADSLWRGNTTVAAGTLLVNANHNVIGGGVYDVQTGGTLGGDGSIAGAITVDSGGTLSGGDSLNVSSVALNGTYAADLISGGSFGSLVSSGPFTIGSDASLAVLAASPLAAGQTFTIIDTNNQLTGTFAGLSDGTEFAAGPNSYRINYANGDVTLTTVVPEPTALALLSIGSIAALRRRR